MSIKVLDKKNIFDEDADFIRVCLVSSELLSWKELEKNMKLYALGRYIKKLTGVLFESLNVQ